MITIKKKKFKVYLKNLVEFEQLLSKKNIDNNKGYLIDKFIIDELKEKLFYKDLAQINPQNFENEIEKKIKEDFKITGGEPKIFKTFKELNKSLTEKKEFVIINFTILSMIRNGNFNHEEGLIKFDIKSNKLILYLNNAEKIYFNKNSNLITIKQYDKMEYIYEKDLDKIYKIIVEYYNFEQLLIKKLKEQKKENIKEEEGYLIDKISIDNLEKYSNYNKIKKYNLLENKESNKEQIKEIINENFLLKKPEIPKINTIKLKDSSSLKTYFKK